jgi:hypothetical protein
VPGATTNTSYNSSGARAILRLAAALQRAAACEGITSFVRWSLLIWGYGSRPRVVQMQADIEHQQCLSCLSSINQRATPRGLDRTLLDIVAHIPAPIRQTSYPHSHAIAFRYPASRHHGKRITAHNLHASTDRRQVQLSPIILVSALIAGTSIAQRYPLPVTYDRVIKSPVNPAITISYKHPDSRTCATAYKNQNQYSGFVNFPPNTLAPYQQNYSINTFLWFIEARNNPETAPLTIVCEHILHMSL